MNRKPGNESWIRRWGALNLAMQYSWTLLFSLLLPLLGGLWLDNKLGTTPLFVLIGSVLGILAATVGVARMAIRTFAQVADDNADQEAGADDEEEEPD